MLKGTHAVQCDILNVTVPVVQKDRKGQMTNPASDVPKRLAKRIKNCYKKIISFNSTDFYVQIPASNAGIPKQNTSIPNRHAFSLHVHVPREH